MHNESSRPLSAAARRIRCGIVISLLIVTAGVFEAAPQVHVVSGTVRTADGRPLAGATIRVSGATGAARGTTVRTQSDRNGNYRVEVRPGHYDVDAFYDLNFNGQTYREMWLDRASDGCGRQLSEGGIVRHFVLRLSGPLRCTANFDPNEPTSYAGGMVQVVAGSLPATAAIRFTLTPVGVLADGTQGRVLTFDRTGEMLARDGGRLGGNAWLHDIPLGRYKISAEAAIPGGGRRALLLRDNAGGASGAAIEISFPAKQMFPYGMQSATVAIVEGRADPQPAPGPDGTSRPQDPGPRGQVPQAADGLPIGAYACHYRSPYAGDIPTGRTIVILEGGRYQAWGGSGTYARQRTGAIQWISGPLAQRGVSVTFAEDRGRASLIVTGGAASDDPDGTNRCVR